MQSYKKFARRRVASSHRLAAAHAGNHRGDHVLEALHDGCGGRLLAVREDSREHHNNRQHKAEVEVARIPGRVHGVRDGAEDRGRPQELVEEARRVGHAALVLQEEPEPPARRRRRERVFVLANTLQGNGCRLASIREVNGIGGKTNDVASQKTTKKDKR